MPWNVLFTDSSSLVNISELNHIHVYLTNPSYFYLVLFDVPPQCDSKFLCSVKHQRLSYPLQKRKTELNMKLVVFISVIKKIQFSSVILH